jgi:uncharacterized Zn-finger protein
MEKNVQCPYCEQWQEINHDDNYDENEIYEQKCKFCDNIFFYTMSFSIDYRVMQAPCKNGEPHDWKPLRGWPEEYYRGIERCSYCGEKRSTKEKTK